MAGYPSDNNWNAQKRQPRPNQTSQAQFGQAPHSDIHGTSLFPNSDQPSAFQPSLSGVSSGNLNPTLGGPGILDNLRSDVGSPTQRRQNYGVLPPPGDSPHSSGSPGSQSEWNFKNVGLTSPRSNPLGTQEPGFFDESPPRPRGGSLNFDSNRDPVGLPNRLQPNTGVPSGLNDYRNDNDNPFPGQSPRLGTATSQYSSTTTRDFRDGPNPGGSLSNLGLDDIGPLPSTQNRDRRGGPNPVGNLGNLGQDEIGPLPSIQTRNPHVSTRLGNPGPPGYNSSGLTSSGPRSPLDAPDMMARQPLSINDRRYNDNASFNDTRNTGSLNVHNTRSMDVDHSSIRGPNQPYGNPATTTGQMPPTTREQIPGYGASGQQGFAENRSGVLRPLNGPNSQYPNATDYGQPRSGVGFNTGPYDSKGPFGPTSSASQRSSARQPPSSRETAPNYPPPPGPPPFANSQTRYEGRNNTSRAGSVFGTDDEDDRSRRLRRNQVKAREKRGDALKQLRVVLYNDEPALDRRIPEADLLRDATRRIRADRDDMEELKDTLRHYNLIHAHEDLTPRELIRRIDTVLRRVPDLDSGL
ncbi:hypothetical protein SISNIDRAFT_109256 [Sistotremastrum niveocremeum HHB9708]|uniref:Uncharacterized protein n=1 Tax=Sistotremastrum niveocremeum HHB9708 TaxID=1314777 RepID=A0A164U0E9_9AGAM|nr:hypothetical protein SISNIDRAFT_109256 [Sistotremastrum niveocremeum HHB9708]